MSEPCLFGSPGERTGLIGRAVVGKRIMKCKAPFWEKCLKGPPGRTARFEQGANDEEGVVSESCVRDGGVRRPAVRRDARGGRELHDQGGFAGNRGPGKQPGGPDGGPSRR